MNMLSKKIIVIIVAIAAVIMAAGGYLVWRYVDSQRVANGRRDESSNTKVVVSNVCGDDIAIRVSPALANNDISATRVVADEILKLDNYKGDVDCSYILTRFYLMTGQNNQAGAALDAMEAARAVGSEYSLAFNPPVMPIATLRNALEVSRTNALENKSNQPNTDDLNDMDKAWQDKK